MANTTATTATNHTPTTHAARAAVDDAVQIATANVHQTTAAAQAASQRYLDFVNQTNRDVLSLWTSVAEASLHTMFGVQNAALSSSQAAYNTSAKVTQDVISQWVGQARQAQATTLKTLQSSTKLLDRVSHE